MKVSLKVGIRGSLTTEVGPGNVITLGGDRRAAVFSTPSMVYLMEYAAREALRGHLDDGEESVGIDVQVQHTSATPARNSVTAEAVVSAIEKNVVSFEIVARDPWGEIGKGTHRRAIIRTERFAQHLAENKPRQLQVDAALPSLDLFQCNESDSILSVSLNRADKRNALNEQMTNELISLLDWLENAGAHIRCVVVSGAGETFCAGDDVGNLPDDLLECRKLSLRRGDCYARICDLPQVFIAAIDGLALGGGFVFAAACDFRIATPRAKFGLPEAQLGWPPNYGMGIIQSVIGRGNTLQLALSGQTIDARTASELRFLSQIVAPDRLTSAANRLAADLSQASPAAQAKVKMLLSPRKSWKDSLAADAFMECLTTETARASIAKFRKR